jgi:hypothetical protein
MSPQTSHPPLPPGAVSFAHLHRMSDRGGLFEHAHFTEPRPEHGYCIDDIARGLVVVAREPELTPELEDLADSYLWLVTDAQTSDGRFHNRRDQDLRWIDSATLEDCWGRALWGLGTAAARLPRGAAERALTHFDRSVVRRSPYLRSMAFAALGAAEVLERFPHHEAARWLLADAATMVRQTSDLAASWPWPEDRLRYANATVPEALLAAGALLGDHQAATDGLSLLGWLVDVETAGDHLSMTPVGGWVTGEPRPGFDQQPIEVAALADACGRAYAMTGDRRWLVSLERCTGWFQGNNDVGVSLVDVVSGGGCDGLHRAGRNENQGAESTLALISTFQLARRLL